LDIVRFTFYLRSTRLMLLD